MFNTKNTLLLSSYLLSACSQGFQDDSAMHSPKDYSQSSSHQLEQDSNGNVVVLQTTLEGAVIEASYPIKESVYNVALLADIEEGEWISQPDSGFDLPLQVEEVVNELSAAGEGELNFLPIDISSDKEMQFENVIDGVTYAIDSGAEIIVLSFQDDEHHVGLAIDSLLKD
jgi:hypothetical protein